MCVHVRVCVCDSVCVFVHVCMCACVCELLMFFVCRFEKQQCQLLRLAHPGLGHLQPESGQA